MRRSFVKAVLISLGACAAAVFIAFLGSFVAALFLLALFLIVWCVFCGVRAIVLRRSGPDRESYGFALGGATSSAVLLIALAVLSQAV
ncbi:MAG: hypothetical protein ACM336_16555 [Acidobacteriota bacterium]